MGNVIKDLKYIFIVFAFSMGYSCIFNGTFDLKDSIQILIIFTFSLYICTSLITYNFNLMYMDDLHKKLTLLFLSLGIISFSYYYIIKSALDLSKEFDKLIIVHLIFSFYESIILVFAFKYPKMKLEYRKAFIITIIVSLSVSYLAVHFNYIILSNLESTKYNTFNHMSRIVDILLELYSIKLVNKLKCDMSENLYIYLKAFVIIRVIMQFTSFFNTYSSLLKIILPINCILVCISQVCALRIIVGEIIKNPYLNIYNKLVKKTENFENTFRKLCEANEEKRILKSNYEKKQHEDEIKNELLTNISHEFKTPVNVIYSAVQMQDVLKTNGKIDEIAKYNSIIKQNCNRLIRLINNFIDSTRFEKGNINTNFNYINIVDLTESIVMSVIPYAKRKNLNLVFDTTDEEIFVFVDEQLYDRLILNLLSNAIKYSKDTGNIYVNMYNIDKNVEIVIKDEGIGINEANLKVIFNRFERIDKSYSRNTEGSGLGLHIVKKIIDILNGNIEISSKENYGTTVKVIIPQLSNIKYYEKKNSSYNCDCSINHCHEVEIEMSDIYL